MRSRFQSPLLACLSWAGVMPLAADWRDEIGFTRLQLLAAAEVPAAPSQGLTQAEAFENPTNYTPDTASALFTGKTFALKSGSSGVSGHAQYVAGYFYGNTSSLITGPCPVDLYSADGWLSSGFLKMGFNDVPAVESRAVGNHSWIATALDTTDSEATEANRRLDYAINRDGFVCAVGVNNGNTTTLPQLLGQSYHTISVGLTNGNHSAGFTTLDVTGRIKPDIVAPDGATSFSTPMVAGAAGVLHAKLAVTEPALEISSKPRVIKALLLATATKDTVASWSNTPARPLDLRYGAGELNINHAYNALRAGRATASNSISHHPRGWGAETVGANSSKTYFFTIAPGAPSTPFSAALTWHRVVTKGILNTWTASLANLNLKLHHASGFTLGTLVAESLSTVDNVEMVYQSALPPGTYAMVVENTSATATAYAVAWHSLPAVTIATTMATAREIDLQAGLVTVSRTGDTTLPLLVPLAISGTAVPGTHFQALPASVTIPAGQASTSIPIIPVSDAIAQGDRSVIVAVSTDFALVRNAAQTAVVTIQDKPFDAWRFANFTGPALGNPAISSETADPDGDDLPNLIEYALSLDPGISSISPITIGQTSGYLTLTAPKNPAATDILWSAEVTADLDDWQPAVTSGTSTTFVATDFIPVSTAPKRFIRLKITR